MWSKKDSELEDIPRKSKLKWNTASSGYNEAPSNFSSQRAVYLSSDKKISIIATLHFDVIVRQVMALSLERRNFFPNQIAGNERWEVVQGPQIRTYPTIGQGLRTNGV